MQFELGQIVAVRISGLFYKGHIKRLAVPPEPGTYLKDSNLVSVDVAAYLGAPRSVHNLVADDDMVPWEQHEATLPKRKRSVIASHLAPVMEDPMTKADMKRGYRPHLLEVSKKQKKKAIGGRLSFFSIEGTQVGKILELGNGAGIEEKFNKAYAKKVGVDLGSSPNEDYEFKAEMLGTLPGDEGDPRPKPLNINNCHIHDWVYALGSNNRRHGSIKYGGWYQIRKVNTKSQTIELLNIEGCWSARRFSTAEPPKLDGVDFSVRDERRVDYIIEQLESFSPDKEGCIALSVAHSIIREQRELVAKTGQPVFSASQACIPGGEHLKHKVEVRALLPLGKLNELKGDYPNDPQLAKLFNERKQECEAIYERLKTSELERFDPAYCCPPYLHERYNELAKAYRDWGDDSLEHLVFLRWREDMANNEMEKEKLQVKFDKYERILAVLPVDQTKSEFVQGQADLKKKALETLSIPVALLGKQK